MYPDGTQDKKSQCVEHFNTTTFSKATLIVENI